MCTHMEEQKYNPPKIEIKSNQKINKIKTVLDFIYWKRKEEAWIEEHWTPLLH